MTNFCIDILNEQDLIDLDLNEIKKRSEQLLCLLFKDKEIIEKSVFKNINVNEKELYVDILICTNKKIHQLNKQY